MQQQPVARDLRTISSALKMITDMERVGDHAADISEIILMMDGKPYIKDLEHIKSMAKETTFMLNNSIDAFVHKDQMLAADVITHDDVVDEADIRTSAGGEKTGETEVHAGEDRVDDGRTRPVQRAGGRGDRGAAARDVVHDHRASAVRDARKRYGHRAITAPSLRRDDASRSGEAGDRLDPGP